MPAQEADQRKESCKGPGFSSSKEILCVSSCQSQPDRVAKVALCSSPPLYAAGERAVLTQAPDEVLGRDSEAAEELKNQIL